MDTLILGCTHYPLHRARHRGSAWAPEWRSSTPGAEAATGRAGRAGLRRAAGPGGPRGHGTLLCKRHHPQGFAQLAGLVFAASTRPQGPWSLRRFHAC